MGIVKGYPLNPSVGRPPDRPMLPCRKHPTNRAEYVNKCKNQSSYAPKKPPSSPKSGKEERPHPTTQRHETTTERARSSTERTKATKFHTNHECTPKVSNVQASQVSTHLKSHPEVSTYPEKHPKVSHRTTN